MSVYGIMRACATHLIARIRALLQAMGTVNPAMIAAVFMPHWITGALVTCFALAAPHRGPHLRSRQGRMDVAITALVYAVTDNAIHALCLWAAVLALTPTPL